jgi:hypothetical protein
MGALSTKAVIGAFAGVLAGVVLGFLLFRQRASTESEPVRAESTPPAFGASELRAVVDAVRRTAITDSDEALRLCDEAVARFEDERGKLQGHDPSDVLRIYTELISESDRLVSRLETPEYEAGLPERDLLLPENRRWVRWGKSSGVEMTFSERQIEMKGVGVPGGRGPGVVSFGGWDPPWHDLVLDLNFTIQSGGFQLCLRYWPQRRWFQLEFDQRSGYELDKAYQVTIRVKGSTVTLLAPDQNPQFDILQPTTSRTGGVGFGLRPGSVVRLSTCRLKLLRQGS